MLRNGGKWPCPLTGSEDDWILVPATALTAEGKVIPGAVAPPGRNPATNPQTPQPQQGAGPMKLNKDLSRRTTSAHSWESAQRHGQELHHPEWCGELRRVGLHRVRSHQ